MLTMFFIPMYKEILPESTTDGTGAVTMGACSKLLFCDIVLRYKEYIYHQTL